MKRAHIVIFILIIAQSIVFSQADPKFADYLKSEREKLPVEGEMLYDCSTLSNYRFGANNGATKRSVDVDPSLPFSKAFQLDIKQAGNNAWEPQLQTPQNQNDVKNGDILVYIFYTRVLESAADDGFGQSFFYVQRAESPWTGLGSRSLTIRSEWHKYYVIAQAAELYPPGKMEATFHLGFVKQQVEIGGIIALNLGSDVDINDLPITPIYYAGQESDATWRSEAAARIEEYRKGDLVVNVKNINGQAVKNAVVKVEMQNHAYGFGNFLAHYALENSPGAEKYRSMVLELFNRATTPFYMGGNEDNWGWFSSEGARNNYRNLAKWLNEQGIPTKGHVLIWPGWQWMPSFFEDLKNDPPALKNAINNHLLEIVPVGEEYGLVEWDVVNEPHVNHDVMDILGEEILVEWYNRVHEIDPKPRLILNEYNILAGGGRKDFQDNLARLVEFLQAHQTPLGGIGMQCHFDENLTGIPNVLEFLDRFSAYNIPIQITEFDVDIRDEEKQAAYLRDFYTAVFSHPATDKIVMWGFYEATMWKPGAALVRTDWSFKPNYYAYTDLVFNKWWTITEGLTDRDGNYRIRGFLGDYKVSASMDGETVNQTLQLRKEGTATTLALPIVSTDVEINAHFPKKLLLVKNHPNPFNPVTEIRYDLPADGYIEMCIYNVSGQRVRTLISEDQLSGSHTVIWNGCNDMGSTLGSGVYTCRICSPLGIKQIKMLLLK